MSADRGRAAEIHRLIVDLTEDRAALDRCRRDIEEGLDQARRVDGARAPLALAAIGLQGWYTAIESYFERVARQIDGAVPAGDRWHAQLVSQVTVDVPGLRPALLPRQLLPTLAVLRGFRHFLRHAYGVDLDLAHLTANGARALAIHTEINDALGVFESFLRESVEPNAGPPAG